MNVRFDHFGVVVGRTGKGDIGLFTQFPGSVDYRKGLLVAEFEDCFISVVPVGKR